MTISTTEILILFLSLMGPTKALIVFAGLSASLPAADQRRMAVKTVIVASIVTYLFLWVGDAIIAAIHVQIPALKVAGGIILLLFALGLVLGTGHKDEAESGAGDPAVFPLAMPLIASPQGIVILITFAATFEEQGRSPAVLYVALGITMAVNLVSLLFGTKILKHVPPAALQVVMKLAGILLTALAVQLVFWGLLDIGVIETMGDAAH